MKWSDVQKICVRKRKSLIPDMKIPKGQVEHPSKCGFRRDLGLPRGEKAHWRMRLGRGCLHVREYSKFYRAHWDVMDPTASIAGHFFLDVIPFILKVLFVILLLVLLATVG